MKKIAIIGGGISGMAAAHNLKNKYKVEIFEKDSRPGGLIKCDVVDGNLYHMVGGHVFNSRRQDVLDWFWNFFDKEKEFTKSVRNAVAYIDKPIGYPVENHLHQMQSEIIQRIIDDLIEIKGQGDIEIHNFEEFLKHRFGKTLYKLYFEPYNKKIWKQDLTKVPISWLEGKLPMPTVEEILFNNIKQEKEMKMVHSTFYYPKNNGSQFVANRLAEGLKFHLNAPVTSLKKSNEQWCINNEHYFDKIIFAGNIKQLPEILESELLNKFEDDIQELEYHGTTTVLCEIDPNDYSWIYMPNVKYDAHRIICTGNFSKNNNKEGIMSATVEFTDFMALDEINKQLKDIPFKPKYITHKYTEFTYPIQDVNTKSLINKIKYSTEKEGLYLTGRFAEWEYYNMDAAMGAAMDLAKNILR
jgi:protoporphyrinogen oxidase